MTPQETLISKLPDFDNTWPAETQLAWLHSFGELTSLMRSEDKSQMWARARELFNQGFKARAAWRQLVVEFGDVVPRHPTSLYDRWKYWEQQQEEKPVIKEEAPKNIDTETIRPNAVFFVEKKETVKEAKPRISLKDIPGSKNLPKKMRNRIEELFNQEGNFAVMCSKIRAEFGDLSPSEATLYGWLRKVTTKRGPRPQENPHPPPKPDPPRKVQVVDHLPQKGEPFDWSSVNTEVDLKKSSACRRDGLPNIYLEICLTWQTDNRIKNINGSSAMRLKPCLDCPNWIRDKAVLQDLAEKFDILEET